MGVTRRLQHGRQSGDNAHDGQHTHAPTGQAGGLQNEAQGNSDGQALKVIGFSVATLQVSGEFKALILFEASLDGKNWTPLRMESMEQRGFDTATRIQGIFRADVTGLDSIRAQVCEYENGAVTVIGLAVG